MKWRLSKREMMFAETMGRSYERASRGDLTAARQGVQSIKLNYPDYDKIVETLSTRLRLK